MNCKHDDRHSVIDSHSGDSVCTYCGLVLHERLIFELQNPTEYSKSYVETHDSFFESTDDTSSSLKESDDATFNKINKRAQYSCSTKIKRIYLNWKVFLIDNTVAISDNAIEMTLVIIKHLLDSGGYYNIVGTNRRGLIAACVYIASTKLNEQCELATLYVCFNIKAMHFFYGRRYLYEWNQKNHLCDWFLD